MTKQSPPPVKIPSKLRADPELFSFFSSMVRSNYEVWFNTGGQTGGGGLTTTNVSEGTNYYYTEDRFNSSFSAKTSDDIAVGSVNKFLTTEKEDELRLFSMVMGS